MPRPCADSAAVGAEMLATVAVAVTALRQHLIDPDPKVALRAVAELTKLLGVCARHGLAVGETESRPHAASAGVPDVASPAPGACEPPSRTPPSPAGSHGAPHSPGAGQPERDRRGEGKTDRPVRAKTALAGGRGAREPSLAPPAPNLPPGGRTLTSFLGTPAAKADAG